jgi:hypothetical protein
MDYVGSPARRGQAWLWDEFVQLAQELADPQLSLKAVAEAHQRSPRAIQLAAHRVLIPAGIKVDETAAFDWVRAKLTGEEPYHWEGVLVERLRGAGQDLVLPEAHQAMMDALKEGKPLAEIAGAAGSTQRKVARRLVVLGFAYDLAEVVDALGCDERDLLDEAACEREMPLPGRLTVLSLQLWLRQADGAEKPGWGSMPRVSIHRTGEQAVRFMGRVLAELAAQDVRGSVEYQIAHRGFDSAVGITYSGDVPVGPDRAEIPRQAQAPAEAAREVDEPAASSVAE